jgi:tyrosinase
MLRKIAIGVLLLFSLDAAAQVRVRKNIDDLSDAELKAFAHAVQKLKDNPDPKTNYVFWADIHGFRNDDKQGPCEHRSEVLWPWHRAYLLSFEDALRASDPPVTSNVTIPYWDWSQPPSGNRYPKAFETMAELMGVECKPPDCRIETPTHEPALNPDALGKIQKIDNWAGYGGKPKPSGGGKGQLESQAHDYVHGDFIGGLNDSTDFAARDPLFFAHHAFMDYLWAQWQEAHPGAANDPVCKECPINFLPGKRVGDYLDIAILGYRYEPRKAQPRAAARKLSAGGLTRMLGIDLPTSASAVEIPLSLPKISEIESVVLNFEGVTVPMDASYLVNIYLVPAGTSAAARHKTVPLTFFASWRASAGHADHGATTDEPIDITDRLLQRLKGESSATKWVLQAEIIRSSKGRHEPVPFRKPFGWKKAEVIVKSAPPETVK